MTLRTKGEQKAYLDGFEMCAECIEKYLSDEGKKKLECYLSATRNAVEIEDIENEVKRMGNCGEVMDFPKTFDEFAEQYSIKDTEERYSNGVEFIPVFRVKQWLEHISEKTLMIDKSSFDTEQYKTDLQSAYDCGYNKALSENKGEWIPKERLTDCSLYIDIVCSECGYVGFEGYAYGYELNEIDAKRARIHTKELDLNFCPCCGAKMDEG